MRFGFPYIGDSAISAQSPDTSNLDRPRPGAPPAIVVTYEGGGMATPKNNLRWFYLSIVKPATADTSSRFVGGAVVQATSEPGAIQRCMALKIDTDGEILVWEIPDKDLHRVPLDMRNRQLTREEIFARLEGQKVKR